MMDTESAGLGGMRAEMRPSSMSNFAVATEPAKLPSSGAVRSESVRELFVENERSTPSPLAEAVLSPLPGVGFGEARVEIDDAVQVGAREVARRTGTSLATVACAAWALVLARTTGDSVPAFGVRSMPSPMSSAQKGGQIRLHPRESLMIHVRVEDSQTVAALLASVRVVPFKGSSPDDGAGSDALYPTTWLVLSLLGSDSALPLLRDGSSPTQAFDRGPPASLTLTLSCEKHLEIRAEFDRRRYRDAVVARLLGYFSMALGELLADEATKIGQLDVLPPQERRRVLCDWNATVAAFPDEQLIHEGFEAQVRLRPNAVAVECDAERLTFADLEARANQVAAVLIARGARPHTYVGVCLPRGIALVVALLGVAKSGAAYVAFDPDYPAARLSFMVSDADVSLVVTDEAHRHLLPCDAVVLDGADAHTIAAGSASPPGRIASPGDECYAMFTSGSLGQPKAVVLSHRAVVNTLDWVSRTLAVGPGDRLLFVTSPCFDLSVYDTFGVLAAGATVVVATTPVLLDPDALAKAVVDLSITVWDSTPSGMQRLLPLFPDAGDRGALRLVMLSGDRIPLTLPSAVRSIFPSARVVSLGGATEAAIWSNWFDIGRIDPRWTSVPYGRPIQNARYHVLDSSMRPVPIGATGDLYIGGSCLAEGYLNRPELTAERFVADPFSSSSAERLYKTGDLARYFDDGELEFLGRGDSQVKVRGFRVELGEVESALLAVPGVREGACLALSDASGQNTLVAYLVPKGEGTLRGDAVRAAMAKGLPEHMIPSQIVLLDAMPLTCNGKVDRKALTRPTVRPKGASLVVPRNETERAVLAIWNEMLGSDGAGVTDNFFNLGGHSLLAVMLIARIRRDLEVRLPVSQVLESPTVAGLAAAIARVNGPRTPRGHAVALAGAASRPPVFLVSGAGGHGFAFGGLASLVAEQHAVYALTAIGADGGQGDETRDRSVEEIALVYVAEIEAIAPEGPVIVGGYSFGAGVALELAHQLRLRGRAVPLLISLDGFAPGFPAPLPPLLWALMHLKAFIQGDASARRAYVVLRGANLRRRVLQRLRREDQDPLLRVVDDDEIDDGLRHVTASLLRAGSSYAPAHRGACDVLLIKAGTAESRPGARMEDPCYGWGKFTSGSISIVTVPGCHNSLFDGENLGTMARAILSATAALGAASA